MKKLMLVSSSRLHGSGFLEYCLDAIQSHFASAEEVLFVPYALKDRDGYEEIVAKAFELTGIGIRSQEPDQPQSRAVSCDSAPEHGRAPSATVSCGRREVMPA